MSTIIEDILARKVFNDRGEETIEVEIVTNSSFGRIAAPAGKSRGEHEVISYPDGGVDEAIGKVDELISPELVGMNSNFQEEIDKTLKEIDGTKNYSNLGGNTCFSVSLANVEAAANSYNMLLFQYLGGYDARYLPYPLGNVISGGKHSDGCAPDFQEFLVLPHGADSIVEAAQFNVQVHRRINFILQKKAKQFNGGKSDEGAWIANIGNIEAFDILTEASDEIGNELGINYGFGIDVAASSLWDSRKNCYFYQNEGKKRTREEQLNYLLELIDKYPLVYVEDPFHEEDFESFAELTKKVNHCLICGDDLFVTNKKRLKQGMSLQAANSIIIKVNQIGTLTEASETIELAKNTGYVPIVSHRSGDTCDKHIAHLAVGLKCPIIKTGVVGGGRVAKLNELIRIEEFLSDRAKMHYLKIF